MSQVGIICLNWHPKIICPAKHPWMSYFVSQGSSSLFDYCSCDCFAHHPFYYVLVTLQSITVGYLLVLAFI